jgi:hypothetical protein
MSSEHYDPSGNTEAFQAFARRTGTAALERTSRVPQIAIVAGAAAAAVVVAALIWYFVTH